MVYAIDSSTISLCLKLCPWAKFRTTKAGIISDEVIKLTGVKPSKCYPETLRMLIYEDVATGKIYRFQPELVFRDAKQFTGLTHCQARNKEALSFAFNASLTSVNLAKAFARQQGMVLSVGSTKTLLRNAAMVDRFIAMSRNTPNMRLNNTDFKELLFYGVRAAV